MLGVIVNTVAILIGSAVGLLCRRGIPQKIADAVMIGLGLCTMYIGISGMLVGENTLVLIASMVFGAACGTLIDLDGKLTALGDLLSRRLSRQAGGNSITEGFVTASMLFCIGSMTIMGSLNAGLTGDNELLFTKSLLDLISSSMLSASLGVGVMCAAAFVLTFQGAIVLSAGFLGPLLTAGAVNELTCVGSLLIVGVGLNLTGITKLKIVNYLPAIFFAPFFYYFAQWISGLIG